MKSDNLTNVITGVIKTSRYGVDRSTIETECAKSGLSSSAARGLTKLFSNIQGKDFGQAMEGITIDVNNRSVRRDDFGNIERPQTPSKDNEQGKDREIDK